MNRWIARDKWIPIVIGRTVTNRNVIDTRALCIDTAGSQTWIDTLKVRAGSIIRAVCISNTLWSATHVRITVESTNTNTFNQSTGFFTNCISTTALLLTRDRLVINSYSDRETNYKPTTIMYSLSTISDIQINISPG